MVEGFLVDGEPGGDDIRPRDRRLDDLPPVRIAATSTSVLKA